MPIGQSPGFDPPTREHERRALIDLRRRNGRVDSRISDLEAQVSQLQAQANKGWRFGGEIKGPTEGDRLVEVPFPAEADGLRWRWVGAITGTNTQIVATYDAKYADSNANGWRYYAQVIRWNRDGTVDIAQQSQTQSFMHVGYVNVSIVSMIETELTRWVNGQTVLTSTSWPRPNTSNIGIQMSQGTQQVGENYGNPSQRPTSVWLYAWDSAATIRGNGRLVYDLHYA